MNNFDSLVKCIETSTTNENTSAFPGDIVTCPGNTVID
jgi:hypothetical protein